MALNANAFRLGPANIYRFEGVAPAAQAYVLMGYVQNVTVSVVSQRVALHGGQLGTSDADIVVTGAQCTVELSFEEITLDSWQRALEGNTQSWVDDATHLVRKLEIQANPGQSMRALARKMKIVPLVGANESTNLEETLTIPLSVTAGDSVKYVYSNNSQGIIAAKYVALPDSAIRNRFWYWGTDPIVNVVPPLGF